MNTPKKSRIMSNVQDLFWCDARDEQGSLLHAPDCNQHDGFVVQGKKQETNTGMQAKGTVLGPHTHPPAPTAGGWRTPTARPVGGQSGEGQRLTSDAPHNGGRHPPRGHPSVTPTAINAGPQGRTLWGRCWVPTPAPTAHGTHGSQNPSCPLQRTGGRERDSA